MMEAIMHFAIAFLVVAILFALGALVLFPKKEEQDPYAKPHGWEE